MLQLTDFTSPEFFANPYPVYEKLRAEGPLAQGFLPGIWMTGHHQIISSLLKDPRMGRQFLQAVTLRYGPEAVTMPAFSALSRTMLMLNPPDHTRLRSLLMRAFNSRQMDQLRAVVKAVADRLIQRLRQQPGGDLREQFALALPVEVICELLDVPLTDSLALADAARDAAQALDMVPMTATQLAAANQAMQQLEDYFKPILQARRRQPGTDLISLLIQIEQSGEQFTETEIISNVILLFLAGHETTTNLICNALIALHQHPEQWEQLCHQPAKISRAVEECLRYDSSVQRTVYSALESFEMAGQKIEQGNIVVLFLGSANRDPAVFDQPDVLDINREIGPGKLMSFGGGIHYCLGARLATMEIEVALQALIQAFPKLHLTQLEQPDWAIRNTLRGVRSLPARWESLQS